MPTHHVNETNFREGGVRQRPLSLCQPLYDKKDKCGFNRIRIARNEIFPASPRSMRGGLFCAVIHSPQEWNPPTDRVRNHCLIDTRHSLPPSTNDRIGWSPIGGTGN